MPTASDIYLIVVYAAIAVIAPPPQYAVAAAAAAPHSLPPLLLYGSRRCRRCRRRCKVTVKGRWAEEGQGMRDEGMTVG